MYYHLKRYAVKALRSAAPGHRHLVETEVETSNRA